MLTTNQTLIFNKCKTDLPLDRARLSDEYYYDSIPQCIIDAVYSIGANYSSTRNTVIRYCDRKGVTRLYAIPGTPSDAHKVENLIDNIDSCTDGLFGADELFENKQKTSTKNGILKAEAVRRFAKTLFDNGIKTIADIREASADDIARIETQIKTIPGQKSGISFSYFLMLSGNEDHMKIDRWLLRFVGEALDIPNYSNVGQAYIDLLAVCEELKITYPDLTPRVLDHTIWSHIRAIEIAEIEAKRRRRNRTQPI